MHRSDPAAPYYLARLTPYRDTSHAIDGVVATFVDVTGLADRRSARAAGLANSIIASKTFWPSSRRSPSRRSRALPRRRISSKSFLARLHAMARSHELLSRGNWADVGVEEVARQALSPYLPPDEGRLAVSGPR